MSEFAVNDHVSVLLKLLGSHALPGVKIQKFIDVADKYIKENNLISINKGYDDGRGIPFPYPLCMCINNCVAHGIPSPKYAMEENDIITFDLGIQDKKTKDCADAAFTIGVPPVAGFNTKLMKVAKETLYRGIDVVKPGIDIFKLGDAMEAYAQSKGYVISRAFLSHSIGKKMHEKPNIPNVHVILEEGQEMPDEMILHVGQKICLEPIVTQYDRVGMGIGDGWSVLTKDNRNAAMFEHMIEVTKDGHKILTTHIERDYGNSLMSR